MWCICFEWQGGAFVDFDGGEPPNLLAGRRRAGRSIRLALAYTAGKNAQYLCQSAVYSVKYVHNSLLQLALDGGFAAAAGYLAFVIYGTVGVIKRYRRDRNPYWLLVLFLIIVLFMHALFDF